MKSLHEIHLNAVTSLNSRTFGRSDPVRPSGTLPRGPSATVLPCPSPEDVPTWCDLTVACNHNRTGAGVPHDGTRTSY